MIKPIRYLKSILTLVISSIILAAVLIIMNRFTPDLFSNMFKKLPWIRTQQNTHTSITSIENKSELITARMSLDFINQLEGAEGQYIEILTYEVTAGVDSENNTVKIMHSNQTDALVVRNGINLEEKDAFIKPVKQAFEQKAIDYAVQNGILNIAKEKGERLLKNLSGIDQDFQIPEFFNCLMVPQLPLQFNLAHNYLEKDFSMTLEIDENLSTNENRFLRDSLVLKPSDKNKNWAIYIGDTGATYTGSYKDFYKNFYTTNTNQNNSGRDFVEVFHYFDPVSPDSSEIVSYASDYYRTFFILNSSRIYYITAEYTSEQDLIQEISPFMIYLATSLTQRTNDKDLYEDKYQEYIKNYYKISQNLRLNDDAVTLESAVKSLIRTNIAFEKFYEQSENQIDYNTIDYNSLKTLTPDEKLFIMLSNIKQKNPVYKTDNNLLNAITDFYVSLEHPDSLKIAEQRQLEETLLNKLDSSQINLYKNYLYSYFLQNAIKLEIPEEEINRYKEFLSQSNSLLFNRNAIIDMTSHQRNEYFKKIFQNQLKNSRVHVDTSDKTEDILPSTYLENNSFLYLGVDINVFPPEEILKEINLLNNNHKITDCFILVFNQTQWNWGDFFIDSDIHALVLDDATLRIFPNVANNNHSEETRKRITAFFTKKNQIPFYYYGDWENLQINPYMLKINGQNFQTRRFTKIGRKHYMESDEYGELSTLAQILSNLQHAYYLEETDYYLNTIKDSLLEFANSYIYSNTFRPSPRLILDNKEDKMRRYNY